MAQTLIGHKQSMIDFLMRQIDDDDIVILTDSHTQWEAKKRSGLHVTSQYAKGTFAQEGGIKDLMSGKNIAIWIGKKQHVSEDTLSLYNKELKDVPTKKKRKPSK